MKSKLGKSGFMWIELQKDSRIEKDSKGLKNVRISLVFIEEDWKLASNWIGWILFGSETNVLSTASLISHKNTKIKIVFKIHDPSITFLFYVHIVGKAYWKPSCRKILPGLMLFIVYFGEEIPVTCGKIKLSLRASARKAMAMAGIAQSHMRRLSFKPYYLWPVMFRAWMHVCVREMFAITTYRERYRW